MYAGMGANEKAAYACGGIVVAGVLYLVAALIFKLVGVNRVMRFLPPVVTGPIIICIGLSLASSAISNASTNWASCHSCTGSYYRVLTYGEKACLRLYLFLWV